MNEHIEQQIIQLTGAKSVVDSHILQSLWSDYGEIRRYQLEGGKHCSVIVKHIQFPNKVDHPRGWNTTLSHRRKVRSYQIETSWYQQYGRRCNQYSRIPECYGSAQDDNTCLIFLEDLDASGFPRRLEHATHEQMNACLKWLAYFHARFMGNEPKGLWPVGTYWHLATRPDELAALDDKLLALAAPKIDTILNNCNFQTFVHGDAKLANFCFSADGISAAAVDFQYVGGGCGMKDIAYFIGSCLNESECEQHVDELLDKYFDHLKQAFLKYSIALDVGEVEDEWRPLFSYAWADFHRFVKGWSPGHWKIHSFSECITQSVIAELNLK